MKVLVKDSSNEDKITLERNIFIKNNPDYTCDDAINELNEIKKKGGVPDKFPVYCRNCWKVLVFDLSIEESKLLNIKYPSSKVIIKRRKYNISSINDFRYLVVIYTKSRDERDKVLSEVNIKFRNTAYRFACNSIQSNFPAMFVSNSTPNDKFL